MKQEVNDEKAITGDGVVKFIDTTHGREVYIFAHQVVAVTYLPTFKSTVVMGPGSTAIPVQGTVEEAIAAIKQAITNN